MQIALNVSVEVEHLGTRSLLRLTGDLRLWGMETTEAALLQVIKAQVPNEPRELVLDLAAVKHIDTRGVRSLIQVLVECGRRGIRLRVVMPHGEPGNMLRAVRVFDAWHDAEGEPAALAGD